MKTIKEPFLYSYDVATLEQEKLTRIFYMAYLLTEEKPSPFLATDLNSLHQLIQAYNCQTWHTFFQLIIPAVATEDEPYFQLETMGTTFYFTRVEFHELIQAVTKRILTNEKKLASPHFEGVDVYDINTLDPLPYLQETVHGSVYRSVGGSYYVLDGLTIVQLIPPS